MIFSRDKIVRTENDFQLEYKFVNNKENDVEIFLIYNRKTTEFLVFKKNIEDSSKKIFSNTASGFSEATDYFEQLISEQSKQNTENENNAPPIGFLEVLSNSTVLVTMQDGRKASFSKGEYSIKNNIFTILRDFQGFVKTEKYYVDKIGKNPKMLGLYPVGDLETEDGAGTTEEINQDDIDQISNGEDPFNQIEDNPPPIEDGDDEGDDSEDDGDIDSDDEGDDSEDEGDDSEDEGDDSEDDGDDSEDDGDDSEDDGDDNSDDDGDDSNLLTSREIIARFYGMKSYSQLIDFVEGEENLMIDIISMSNNEKLGIMSNLAINFENDAQFENVMRRIILN
jgi:hypothetical protein